MKFEVVKKLDLRFFIFPVVETSVPPILCSPLRNAERISGRLKQQDIAIHTTLDVAGCLAASGTLTLSWCSSNEGAFDRQYL